MLPTWPSGTDHSLFSGDSIRNINVSLSLWRNAMASIGHVVAPGFPYHVIQDGKRRCTGMINSRDGWRGHFLAGVLPLVRDGRAAPACGCALKTASWCAFDRCWIWSRLGELPCRSRHRPYRGSVPSARTYRPTAGLGGFHRAHRGAPGPGDAAAEAGPKAKSGDARVPNMLYSFGEE